MGAHGNSGDPLAPARNSQNDTQVVGNWLLATLEDWTSSLDYSSATSSLVWHNGREQWIRKPLGVQFGFATPNKFESIKTSTWNNTITDKLHSQRHRSQKAPVSSPWLCSQGGEWFMTCWTTGAVTAAAPSGFQCATRRSRNSPLDNLMDSCKVHRASHWKKLLRRIWSKWRIGSLVVIFSVSTTVTVKIYIDLLRLRGVLLKGVPKSSKSGIYDHTSPPVNYHRPWKS